MAQSHDVLVGFGLAAMWAIGPNQLARTKNVEWLTN
jgi:hypothetical protein